MLGRVQRLMRHRRQKPQDSGLLIVAGTSVPADGETGYATGCLYQKTDGGDGTALYVNEGTVSSADFNAVTVA